MTKSQERLGLKKRPTALYLEPEAADELKALSERTGRKQQEFLREAVDAMLKKYRRAK